MHKQRLTTLQIFLAAFRDFCREQDCQDLAKEFEGYTLNTNAPDHVVAEAVELEDGFPPELYARIQEHRNALLEAVHRALLRQLDRCALFERDTFPCRECLTGEYYLGPGESYDFTPEGRPQIIVKARCLGWSDPWNQADRGRPVDYLGIDVCAEFDPEASTFSGELFSIQTI